MRWRLRQIGGALSAIAMLLIAAVGVRAETGTLELKRFESQTRFSRSDYYIRAAMSQSFFVQLGLKAPRAEGPAAEFPKVIRKEPKYETDQPFRGVARLGTQQFGFALDSVTPKAQAKKEEPKAEREEAKAEAAKTAAEKPKPSRVAAYNRLYFDLNHNGDLSDDKPVDAVASPGVSYPPGYAYTQFPRVDLVIDVAGTKVEYGFFLSAMRQASGDFQYANASLSPGVYREGRIKLDGKDRRVILIDFNSNGRFDDETTVQTVSDGRVYPQQGDMLLVDPREEMTISPYDVTTASDRHHVSKLVCVDGRFYDLKVTPAGDRVTLTPSKAATGFVTSPFEQFRAVLYGDLGIVKIGGGEKQVPVPAGQWKLMSYTLDLTAQRQKQKEAAAKKDSEKKTAGKDEPAKESSLVKALAQALLGSAPPVGPGISRSGPTVVSASGAQDAKPIVVREKETTVLPFGPPYKPVVKVEYAQPSQMQLSLALTGVAGEVCTDLRVDGGRPSDKPEFTIKDAKGEVVQKGSFEYG